QEQHQLMIQEVAVAILEHLIYKMHPGGNYTHLIKCVDLKCSANEDRMWVVRLRVSNELPIVEKLNLQACTQLAVDELNDTSEQRLAFWQYFSELLTSQCIVHGIPGIH